MSRVGKVLHLDVDRAIQCLRGVTAAMDRQSSEMRKMVIKLPGQR